MINRYSCFTQEILFEKLINESILYYSPRFRDILNKISDSGNKIAGELLRGEGENSKYDVTFIDIDKEDGYLSFTTMDKAVKSIMPLYPHVVTGDDALQDVYNSGANDSLWKIDQTTHGTGPYRRSRNKIRIGKFVNKILAGKFSDREIEEFVNLFKSVIEKKTEGFLLVDGDDIAKWYNEQTYKEIKGTLGNSCMRDKSPDIFDIYTKNPQVCKMLILVEDDKLLGRALVWKLDTVKGGASPEYFLDRQYTIYDSDVNKFRDYAEKMGWAYKSVKGRDGEVTFGGKKYKLDMTVKVNNYNYESYPYMDTFSIYDPQEGILYNNYHRGDDYYILNNTDGGYMTISDDDYVWSDYHGKSIPLEDAVWSDPLGSYIIRDRSILISRGSRPGWYVDDDYIIYDNYINDFVHIDDTVWLEYSKEYVYIGSVFSAVKYINPDGSINIKPYYIRRDHSNKMAISVYEITDSIWYKNLSNPDKHFGSPHWDSHNCILLDCLTKDLYDNWIPKNFSIGVYKSFNNDGKYYLPIDAEALGIELDMDEEYILDRFNYENFMIDYLPNINKNLLIIKNNLEKSNAKEYQNKLNSINNRIKEIQNKIYM